MAHLCKALKFIVCKSENSEKMTFKNGGKNPNYGIRRLRRALKGQVGSDRMMKISSSQINHI